MLMLTIRCALFAATIGIATQAWSAEPMQNPFAWPEATSQTKPWSYWWWPGSAVDEKHMAEVLKAYRDGGLGGMHIIPIYGVKGAEDRFIPLLSPRWMEMLQFTVSEAEKLGLGIDMTTGTAWPFGGPVVDEHDAGTKYEDQISQLKTGDAVAVMAERESLIAMFAVDAKSGRIEWVDRHVRDDGSIDWKAPEGEWTLHSVHKAPTRQQVKRAAPGGEGNVLDPFSPEAMQRYTIWFDRAFESYKGLKPRAQYHDSFEYYNANWTPELFGVFKSIKGYELREQLPLLLGVGERDSVVRVRYDYRHVLALQHLKFIEAWADWSRKNGFIVRNEAHGAPANLIDVYAAADVPETETFGPTGFKIPGLRTDTTFQGQLTDPLMSKFASSAAHLKGTPLVSSETCTWLGEHFQVSLAQAKTEVDQLFTAGINHIFYHGICYSPLDEPWPGWLFYASVSFAPCNPFWRDFSAFNAYAARCQSVLQSGEIANDVILYLPVHDIWQESGGSSVRSMGVHDLKWQDHGGLRKAAETLWARGYGFDYVSDDFLTSPERIKSTYKTIVVPDCKFIPVETMEAMVRWVERGGTVVFLGDSEKVAPGFWKHEERSAKLRAVTSSIAFGAVDAGVQSASLGKGRVLKGGDIDALLMAAGVRREAMRDLGLTFVRRAHAEGHMYFITNLHEKAVDGWVPLGVEAQSAVLLDPRYADKAGVAAVQRDDKSCSVYLQLQPSESCILRTFTSRAVDGPAWKFLTPASDAPTPTAGTWSVEFIEGGPELPKPYKTDTLATWTAQDDPATKSFGGTARYFITFQKPTVNADDWQLDLGRVCESARVTINGHGAGTLFSLPFRICIGEWLKDGENKLEIEVTNLAANRIRDLDLRGVNWKRFYDANVVNINYKPLDASTWELMDSGLIGPVRLVPMRRLEPGTTP
jgi:hypothetical protein